METIRRNGWDEKDVQPVHETCQGNNNYNRH